MRLTRNHESCRAGAPERGASVAPSGAGRALLLAGTLLLLTQLVACGGSGPPPAGAPPPEVGSLTLTVSGLPTGAQANVNVTGPDSYAATLTRSDTLTSLLPGVYTVTAATVVHEGNAFNPTTWEFPVSVRAGEDATAAVTYERQEPVAGHGNLLLTIAGLPAGVSADVWIEGPAGISRTFTESALIENLTPGDYTVTASDVTGGTTEYSATVAGSPAAVQAGGTVAVAVAYSAKAPAPGPSPGPAPGPAPGPTPGPTPGPPPAPSPDPDPGPTPEVGSLAVEITGLPAGVDAGVTVTGPGGFERSLASSETLEGLVPGYYELSAKRITGPGGNYVPEITGSPALLLPNETVTAAVTFYRYAEEDNDAASNPGVYATFRNTAGPPVWVDRALFNKGSPIDTKGIQYRKSLSEPGNSRDWLAFSLTHGQGTTTTIRLSLSCSDSPAGGPTVIRARVYGADGKMVGQSLSCGDSQVRIALPSPHRDYLVEIAPRLGDPFYTDYVLSIDAFCTGGCTYQPH